MTEWICKELPSSTDEKRGILSTLQREKELIRCKDCKHRDAEYGFCEGRGWPMQLVPDDGFCDKGERKEE